VERVSQMATQELPTPPKKERSLSQVLEEAAGIINERRQSRDVIGLVRRPLSPAGGGDYLSEEVIARLP